MDLAGASNQHKSVDHNAVDVELDGRFNHRQSAVRHRLARIEWLRALPDPHA